MDPQMEKEIKMTEEEFLQQYNPGNYERPSVTVDTLIFDKWKDDFQILLIKRKSHPYQGRWAIPGGFINMDENLEDAAYRELQEETGIEGKKEGIQVEQLYTFGDVGRDPRTRIISVAYIAVLEGKQLDVQGADDAEEARWFSVKNLPPLAFDHHKIIQMALNRLVVSPTSQQT